MGAQPILVCCLGSGSPETGLLMSGGNSKKNPQTVHISLSKHMLNVLAVSFQQSVGPTRVPVFPTPNTHLQLANNSCLVHLGSNLTTAEKTTICSPEWRMVWPTVRLRASCWILECEGEKGLKVNFSVSRVDALLARSCTRRTFP